MSVSQHTSIYYICKYFEIMQERLEQELKSFRSQLLNHPIYNTLKDIDDLKVFTECHVYAVWDFMSLVKKLQIELTTISLPWKPAPRAATARLINESVWGEESDVDERGNAVSHFEMYCNAMESLGANTQDIQQFLSTLPNENSVLASIKQASLPDFIKDFLLFTFDTIENKSLHEIAAVFTFGREDLIPDMFIEMVKNMQQAGETKLAPFRYYLERHIEVDGDQHGPMALEMIANLCDNQPQKWEEVIAISKQALHNRFLLWTGIHDQIIASRKAVIA